MIIKIASLKLTSIIVLTFLLSGCRTAWHHPAGYDNERLRADEQECEISAEKYATEKLSDPSHPRGPRGWKFAYKQNYKISYNDCMTKKGWEFKGRDDNKSNSPER